ncbi:acetylcholinesterase-1-like isoform X2 [Haemaphysalis longicornis]
MDAKHKKAAVSPSTSSVAGKKRNKKRSKTPSRDPGNDAGKKEGQAGAKVKSPNKKAAVSPSKYGGTRPSVAMAGSEKSSKKHPKKQKDAGESAAKAVSPLELSGQAGTETTTPDAGAAASTSKADGTTPQSSVGANQNLRTKPSKSSPPTRDDATKDRPTEYDMAQSPGESEDAQGQSSDGPGVQPAPTLEVPVTAQADAKDGDNPADLPAFQERGYITNILPIIGTVILVVGVLLAVVVSLLVIGRPDTAMVSTTSGEFIGKKVSLDGFDVYRWLGIPYAESTAGKNRFRAPRLITEKQRTMAQEPRPPCPQLVNRTVVGSEDCLHMNVWAPKWRSGAGVNRTLVLASVSYWFQRGSNNDPDWAELAAKASVVVMSPNVRLGVLGFLHMANGIVKNVAKEDAKEAVKWAVANAAAFGACPDGVVLVGHGSGAYMLTEAVTSLNISCSRAILEGPVPGALWPFNTGKLEPKTSLVNAINCIGTPFLRCLRNSSLEVLLRKAAKLKFPFGPSLADLQQFSMGPTLQIPEVIAGVDTNQVRIFFDEYLIPAAVAAGYKPTPAGLWDFRNRFFPRYWEVEESSDYPEMENPLLTAVALYMGGCATRSLVRKASVKGFHYMTDGAEKQLFEPILDMTAVVGFIKDGSVPKMEDGAPWEPWTLSSTTRMKFEEETEAPTQDYVAKFCEQRF